MIILTLTHPRLVNLFKIINSNDNIEAEFTVVFYFE